MLDGWKTAQSSTLSLIPETIVAAKTPPLVFVTMATGTKRMNAMTVSALLPSSTVRNREEEREREMEVGSHRLCAHACLYLQLINTL